MANCVSHTRSNYFRVKDAAAFATFCNDNGLEHWTKQIEQIPGDTFHAISGEEGWPTIESDPDNPINLETAIRPYIDPRDAVILQEIGYEGGRYLFGSAVAIHANQPPVYVNIRHVTAKARAAFGPDVIITEPEY